MRAILFASMAHGTSYIHHYLVSPDTTAMINACRQLGAIINIQDHHLMITGTGGNLKTPNDIIDVGNSGQVLRFISALAALTSGYTVFTGDDSIRNRRPMQALLDGINQLNGFAVSTKQDGHAPIIVKGKMHNGKVKINGEDSQPISALLMATPFLNGTTELEVINPGETPWIDLTLDWMKRMGIIFYQEGYHYYKIIGNQQVSAFTYEVPGDFSSAAFPLAAALLTRDRIVLQNVDMSDVQGDKNLINALRSLDAKIDYDYEQKSLIVDGSAAMKGGVIDASYFIDAVPILAVLACGMNSSLKINNAAIAKYKESDRLHAMADALTQMGADIEEDEQGITLNPGQLTGESVDSSNDHRVAMALTVAGLVAKGNTIINNTDCVAKSFPHFVEKMQGLGANILELS